MPDPRFTPQTFRFLRELAANNRREWFKANKQRYEETVLEPALDFVEEFRPLLHEISPHFLADARPVGGSLFRIYRDVRFSKDKTPYKTHVGIYFRHADGDGAAAPGFYLHLEPRNVFAGAGLWHPPTESLERIRRALVAQPARWRAVTANGRFAERFVLGGDSLKRAPRGYPPDHPLIDDLRRKDFIASTTLTQREVTSRDFPRRFQEICASGAPLVEFVCEATGLAY
ncbi:MAG: DUF2461 domain-containing protein [Solirubrobacterales bacterium]